MHIALTYLMALPSINQYRIVTRATTSEPRHVHFVTDLRRAESQILVRVGKRRYVL